MIIYKYEFPITDNFVLGLPMGFRILRVACQHHNDAYYPYIWALVDPEEPLVQVEFCIYGTGQQIPNHVLAKWQWVETFEQGIYVWHLFKRK